MKRLGYSITSKSMVTTEDEVTAFETWSNVLHASYTLDRYAQFFAFSIESQHISNCNFYPQGFDE